MSNATRLALASLTCSPDTIDALDEIASMHTFEIDPLDLDSNLDVYDARDLGMCEIVDLDTTRIVLDLDAL